MAAKANFNAYHNYAVDSLHQWDRNQVLTLRGLNLATAPEVHFSNKNMARAIVRQATMENHVVTVNIPNSLLQDPLRIYAHIGIYEGSTFTVVETVEIPVIPRVRPLDYQIEDTDGEVYSFNRLENMIENINETWMSANQDHVQATVTSWLDNHPEATTTVQDRSLTADKLVVGTLGYVTPEMYGAAGDGVTDDTSAIQSALAAGKRIVIENGTYFISDTLNVPSNTVIELKNAKIKSTATANKKYIFSMVDVANVKIYGENATLEMAKPETAQQACVSIDKSDNILVKGLVMTMAGGDGVTIGGTNTNEAKNVEIADCVIDNSRRNGVSIIGGVDGVFIHDCVIKNTAGTAPQLGIDIETWDSAYINKNISVYNNRFENNGTGDLTIFEYSEGVMVYNNAFTGSVSVKINTAYNGVAAANPTDISFHDNVFGYTLYIYGIVYGSFSIVNNIFNDRGVMIESPFNVTAEDTANTKSKLIQGNTFNGGNPAITCAYNANALICDNVANDCNVFFGGWGLFNSVIKGNVIVGYNVSGTAAAVFDLNGKVEGVIIENNRVIANANTKSVTRLLYFRGGSTTGNVVRHNDFSKAEFTAVITYDAQGDNLDHNNAIPTCDNYCRGLPTASKKFAGMILSIVGESSIYTYICTLSNGSYVWRDITAKL